MTRFRKCKLAALAVGLALSPAQARDYPSMPIRIIVPASVGGSIDVEARIIGKELGNLFGQEIVIEDRPGASGIIGAEFVAKAAPDGYTLLLFVGDFITVSSLMPHMTFDPNKELLPIAEVSANPLVVVASANAPFSDVKGFVAAAKASPRALTYATYGVGSVNNVVGQWIAAEDHINLLHVPYRSGPEAALAAAAGDVTLAIVSPPAVFPALVEAGKVKVIALTGTERSSYLPSSWPTFAEDGLPIDATVFVGLFGPADMPEAIVSEIDHAISLVLQKESVRERLIQVGINPEHMSPAAFVERIHADKTRYEWIIREMGMNIDK